MNLIIFNCRSIAITQALAFYSGQRANVQYAESTVFLSASVGEGSVRSYDYQNGIGTVLFDCTFREDVTISFLKNTTALVFLFNVSGSISHWLDEPEVRSGVNPMQGTIMANSVNTAQHIQFAADIPVKATLLMVDRKRYLSRVRDHLDEMPASLRQVFQDTEGLKPFNFQSNYSLAITDCIQKIFDHTFSGLAASIYVEAKCLELLSRQLQQYQEDLEAPSKKVLLRQYDIRSISEAARILRMEMQDAPTIGELAKRVGLNRQKLKKGFKLVFNTTINRYLQNERLEYAAALLLSEHTVESAIDAVGYQNKSFFAQKFKDRYGVLPGVYKKKIQENGNYLPAPDSSV